MITIVGGPLSPYVRKVLVVCELKSLPYQIDPIVPFFGNDRFSEISPVRRIPVLIDDLVTLPDSSVICQYLEERYPAIPLYPASLADRASARWLEEYADTSMGDVFIWKIFNEACIKPAIWGLPRDTAAIARAVSEDLPPVMDYLEKLAPAAGFLFGPVSIAVLFSERPVVADRTGQGSLAACLGLDRPRGRHRRDAAHWRRG